MSQPRLSVVLTFYDQRDFVEAAVRSVLDQRREGVEVIAVDDGSTDGTAERLVEYGDWLRVLLLETNTGASAARNAGADAASGEYLAFLDGDDAFMPWTLDVYEKLLQTRPLGIIGSRLWFEGSLPDPGPVPHEVRFVEYDDFFGRDRSITVGSSTLVIRRRSWEKVGGLPPGGLLPMTPSLEELDLLWRVGDAGRVIQVLDPATTFYRVHPRQAIWQTEMMLEAASILCSSERRGRYPGGRGRRLERRACAGGQVLYWTRVAAKNGIYGPSLRLLRQNLTLAAAAVALRAVRLVAGRRMPQTLPLRQQRPTSRLHAC